MKPERWQQIDQVLEVLTWLRSVFRRWSLKLNSPKRRVRTRMHGGVTGKLATAYLCRLLVGKLRP